MLVADHGAFAAGIIGRGQALGIKCVAVGLTRPATTPNDPDAGGDDPDGGDVRGHVDTGDDADVDTEVDLTRLADDAVLLSDLDELHDPVAVARAAEAADVQAVHPGLGPLRTSRALAQYLRAVDIVPVVSLGSDPAEWVAHLRRAGLTAEPHDTDDLHGVDTVSFHVLVSESGLRVLGSVGWDGDIAMAPAAAANARDEALAVSAAAVVGQSGLFTVSVRRSVVVGVDAGLPRLYPLTELVTGTDLLALQIAAAQAPAAEGETAPNEETVGGCAVHTRAHFVQDVRAVSRDADRSGLRLEIAPLAGRGHRGVVRAFAWGADRETAETILARYDERWR